MSRKTSRPLPLRSALADCGRLKASRLLTRVLLGTLVAVFVLSFVVPWTQNVRGRGRVIAYAPNARETPIKAPVGGLVARWMVVEGQQVKAGQLIAELADTDPNILARLGQARDAVQSKGDALASAISIAEEQVQALIDAREAAVANAQAQVEIARAKQEEVAQKLVAAKAEAHTAEVNLKRQRELNAQHLASDRDYELAQLSARKAETELKAAKASLRAAAREVEAAESTLTEKRQSKQASIDKARAELEKLRGDLGENAAKVASAETKLTRQAQMRVVAPRDGTILAVHVREGTDIVKAGDPLATFVPDTEDRAVEIWVDGNDAPLISEGREVRLQFEGWPAVQFIGWPSAAVGTFSGRVAFVDRAARADGKFRVVVLPDPDNSAWPDAHYLRQGVHAKGWVLLNRVSVAYELWRQLNGFPPTVERGATSKGKGI